MVISIRNLVFEFTLFKTEELNSFIFDLAV